MDLLKLLQTQVSIWNAEQKCGFCWSFGAPLTDSSLNKKQLEDCCLQVFVTNLTKRKNRTYNEETSYLNDYSVDYNFDLHILYPDRVDINTYNEQLGHPIDESKWATILHPIDECFCAEKFVDFCKLIGKNLRITNQSSRVRINWLDNNYTGWTYSLSIRDNNPDCQLEIPKFISITTTEPFNGVLKFDNGTTSYEVVITDGRGSMLVDNYGAYIVSIVDGAGVINVPSVDVQENTIVDLTAYKFTEIHGMTFADETELATKFSFADTDVIYFKSENDVTQFTLSDSIVSYDVITSAFETSAVTKFLDYQSKCQRIGNNGFASCDSLNEIYLPNVSFLNLRAFQNCEALTEVEFVKKVSFNDRVFEGCINLVTAKFPLNDKFGSYTFKGCSSLTTIESLPYRGQTTATDRECFSGCVELQNLTIDYANIRGLNTNTFYNCKKLVISGSFDACTILTYGALEGSGAQSLNFPVIPRVGDYVCRDCVDLHTFSSPIATEVRGLAFSGCSSLNDVSIPSVTNLGGSTANNNVFLNVADNGRIEINPSVQTDGDITYLIGKGWTII